MNIFGVDFTSAPSGRKPITCVRARLQGDDLSIVDLLELTDFMQFETLLSSPGPWIAGLDFPFGQSRRLIDNLGWPRSWSAYVKRISRMSRDEFIRVLEAYKRDRPAGDREHRRRVDELAGAISPQKLYGVPVGKMFYEGAPRLLASPASIVPVRPARDPRIVVEAYPALVARRFIGRRSYKSDTSSRQTDVLRQSRAALVEALGTAAFKRVYGVHLRYTDEDSGRWTEDATGDWLDALLCTVQAAWSWRRGDGHYGMPPDVDRAEGWVADPALCG